MAAETYCPEHREAHRLAYHTRKVELQAERAEGERRAALAQREAEQYARRETISHLRDQQDIVRQHREEGVPDGHRYPLPPGRGAPTYSISDLTRGRRIYLSEADVQHQLAARPSDGSSRDAARC